MVYLWQIEDASMVPSAFPRDWEEAGPHFLCSWALFESSVHSSASEQHPSGAGYPCGSLQPVLAAGSGRLVWKTLSVTTKHGDGASKHTPKVICRGLQDGDTEAASYHFCWGCET